MSAQTPEKIGLTRHDETVEISKKYQSYTVSRLEMYRELPSVRSKLDFEEIEVEAPEFTLFDQIFRGSKSDDNSDVKIDSIRSNIEEI